MISQFNDPEDRGEQIKDINSYVSLEQQTNHLTLSAFPTHLLNWIEENGSDLIVVTNLSGIVIYISKTVKKILGYYPAEIIGKQATDYILRNDKNHLVNIFQGSNKSRKFTLSVCGKDGKYTWVEAMIAKLNDERGQPQIIALARDVTDKREAEEMLIRSEKMSVAGQLAAGVAHEIRNPLTSLKGFVQLLQAGIERKDEYYKIMIDEIDKINSITSELLFISKPMTDNRKFESISELIGDVITLLTSQANLHNVKITLEIKENMSISCDKTQIKQVLINLLKNAIEEMTDGGDIDVIVESNSDECLISIIDEGPGIPDDILHKLKEPFFTTKKEGTGLGLMISEKIVENHDGKIEISQNDKKGSTFRVCLPLDK
ncbi:ATP-binding protein [Aquibacillus saliphilus]|uniref:ATP-binding protein n=1 Tax=Aquibacillus saliphilus TaxID=1909422 RepID=UPI001CEFF3BD|nr:ATP-binding protein [Aquibacillus saliphilus]